MSKQKQTLTNNSYQEQNIIENSFFQKAHQSSYKIYKQSDINNLILKQNEIFLQNILDTFINKFDSIVEKRLEKAITPLKEQITALGNAFQQDSKFQRLQQGIKQIKIIASQLKVRVDLLDKKIQSKNSIKIKKVFNIKQQSQLPQSQDLQKVQNKSLSTKQKNESFTQTKAYTSPKKQIKGPQQEIISVSSILRQHQHGKQLFNNLNNALKQRFKQLGKYKLKKMFSYPNTNQNPYFHDVIDKHDNIMLLVKLKSPRTVLAAFTVIPFLKRNIPQPNPDAFIANLTKNKFYKPKNICKTICYDQNFLIFGNSQMRLKVKQDKLYTNFAISKAFFDSKGDNLATFIQGQQDQFQKHEKMLEKIEQQVNDGQKKSKRSFQIQIYQIFQLIES